MTRIQSLALAMLGSMLTCSAHAASATKPISS